MKDKLNQLAIPLMLNNVVSLLIGLCDQAMIGHVSLTGFAAVGIVAGIINSFTGVLGTIAISFNILGARAKGNDDQESLESYYRVHIVQSVVIGAIFSILVFLGGKSILKYGYQLEGETLQDAMNYALIFSLSLGLNLLLFTCSSYLKIINQTKYILIGNLTATILNVIFDYILIFGLFGIKPLGIIGNAIGSVLALVVNLLIYFIILNKRMRSKIRKLDWNYFKISLKLSIPLMLQEFLESTVIILAIGFLVARIGLIEVAVYQLLTTLIQITLMPMYAYGQGIMTMIGEKPRQSSEFLHQGITRALFFYTIIGLLIMMNSELLLSLITNQSLLVEHTISYFPFVCGITVIFIPGTLYKFTLQASFQEQRVIVDTIVSYFLGLIIAFGLSFLKSNLMTVYIGIFVAYFMCFIKFRIQYKCFKKGDKSV